MISLIEDGTERSKETLRKFMAMQLFEYEPGLSVGVHPVRCGPGFVNTVFSDLV